MSFSAWMLFHLKVIVIALKEMKQCGAVRKGKLNKEDETAIEKMFKTLLAETGLEKEALMEELFAANKGSPFHCNALG